MPFFADRGALSRRDVLKTAAAAGIGLITGAAAHGFLYERHQIEVTRETLRVSGLPDAHAGLRIGFLSDIHRSQTVPHAMIETAVRLLMAERPDLIVLGGDYVTWG
ncbi:MAG: twin-arginine translocation signal domain-containing protein, partial [Acidobacteria bacterium]|nr:twin-arginine translocation signal domain-containing protein [Acidobacteriota bacterium]